MKSELNNLQQPVGLVVDNWQVPSHPTHETLVGRFCRLEPLDPARHAESLYAANILDVEAKNWTYLPYGPFQSLADYRLWMEQSCCGSDPQFYAIVERENNRAVGIAAYLRITPASASIEVGHLNYSPLLQQKPAATEAMYLMMQKAFAIGYRRYEWKCHALNAASRAAAQRLGFTFEGIFRQATIVKGRNRDTAWYSIIDSEWPALEVVFQQWLSAANFDECGKQLLQLSTLTTALSVGKSAAGYDV